MHVYLMARFHASFHVQVRFIERGPLHEKNIGDVTVTCQVVHVFRGAECLAVGDEVRFAVCVIRGRGMSFPGAKAVHCEQFYRFDYAEVFLNGVPPYCRIEAGEMALIEAPTIIPVLSVPTEAEIAESIKEFHRGSPVPEPIEVVLPVAGTFQHPFKIKSLFDRTDGRTHLYLAAEIHDNLSLRMFQSDGCIDSEAVALSICCRTKSWEEARYHDLVLHVDEMPVNMGYTTRSELEGNGQGIVVPIAVDRLSRLLRARKITGQIGTFEFALTDEHLEAMRDFASRIPAGKTYWGNFIIFHRPPTGEPAGFDESARLSAWEQLHLPLNQTQTEIT